MITAHGGALGTGRNSLRYFEEMARHPEIEAVEVDIRRLGGRLWLGHVIVPVFGSKRIPFEYVLEFCKTYSKRVNCDVKARGMVRDVVAAAKKADAVKNIYFTGSVSPEEVKYLDGADAYLNNSFYPFSLNAENAARIAEYVASFKAEELKGLNVNYKFADAGVRKAVREAGLGLSVYTVDDEAALKEIVAERNDNVTTNKPDMAYKFLSEL